LGNVDCTVSTNSAQRSCIFRFEYRPDSAFHLQRICINEMSMATARPSSTYAPTVRLSIDYSNASIETERMRLTSISDCPVQLLEECQNLYKSPKAMQYYGESRPQTDQETKQRLDTWAKRWQECDPFSGFKVCLKGSTSFVGTAVLGCSDGPGIAEFAIALMPEFWRQGYGIECAAAIVEGYAGELFSRGKELNGAKFTKISATARPENVASWKCLERLGFTKDAEVKKHGHMRYQYSKSVS
ncbi:MAG: hypothetical protein CYPHOPRED_004269, partial [Cyphobasidiales sp. Tagirdzhanova-0007]